MMAMNNPLLQLHQEQGGDSTMYVFHPGKEMAQFGQDVDIRKMTAEQVKVLRYLNDDRKHNTAEQLLLKAPANEANLKAVEELAPDMMFMGIIKSEDTITPLLESMNIRYVAAELIFDREDSPLVTPEYIEIHHKKGRLLPG